MQYGALLFTSKLELVGCSIILIVFQIYRVSQKTHFLVQYIAGTVQGKMKWFSPKR